MTAYVGPSQHLLDEILNAYRGTGFAPSTTYVGLLTTMPTDVTGTGAVEVVAGSGAGQWSGYARQSIAATTGAWAAPSGTTPRSISNAAALTFPTVSIASSGTITLLGWFLADALTVGNALLYGTFSNYPLPAGKVIGDTDIFQIPISDLVLSQQ
jgi:hypothetical protein